MAVYKLLLALFRNSLACATRNRGGSVRSPPGEDFQKIDLCCLVMPEISLGISYTVTAQFLILTNLKKFLVNKPSEYHKQF